MQRQEKYESIEAALLRLDQYVEALLVAESIGKSLGFFLDSANLEEIRERAEEARSSVRRQAREQRGKPTVD